MGNSRVVKPSNFVPILFFVQPFPTLGKIHWLGNWGLRGGGEHPVPGHRNRNTRKSGLRNRRNKLNNSKPETAPVSTSTGRERIS